MNRNSSPYHVLNVIIRSNFGFQTGNKFIENNHSVILIFHQFLQSAQFQPSDTVSRQNLINNLNKNKIIIYNKPSMVSNLHLSRIDGFQLK